ncbi:chromosomal replication initiator protein DnaA [Candidatus Daviesbacteria bacterium]|nr:chromosomal replication initiator protein DnaA [Candidatus Daviesbacteria bacterium]
MDAAACWNQILSELKPKVSFNNFKTWFSQTRIDAIGENKITISVPSSFHKNQLLDRYESLITEAAAQVLKQYVVLEIKIDSKLLKKKSAGDFQEEEIFHLQTKTQPQSFTLNPRYTLGNFVVGLTNNLAFAAAQAVTENPGVSYNPLYIYGPSGVGKTHLMHAIGNALISKNPNTKAVFAPSEKFMNDFIESIKSKSTESFRHRYRSCDIILIDDIQFISGKDSTQEEFFHTFNDLHSKNSQLVFTSDRPPNEIEKLESRLKSRFQGGLMVDIQLPDFDTRVAILKSKLSEKGESLPEEHLKSIAEIVVSNTRELEGKLIQFLQIKKTHGRPPNEAEIRRILGNQAAEKNTTVVYPNQIIESVNKYFKISLDQITGPRRQKELVLPRQIAMFLIYEECKTPFEKIGEILGGRDHTTIMHGVEKIRLAIGRDREIQRLVIEVKQQLGN